MSTITREFRDVRDEARERLSADLETLRSGFSQLGEDVSELTGQVAALGGTGIRSLGRQVRGTAGRSLGTVRRRMREHPVASSAIAFGLGLTVASILNWRFAAKS